MPEISVMALSANPYQSLGEYLLALAVAAGGGQAWCTSHGVGMPVFHSCQGRDERDVFCCERRQLKGLDVSRGECELIYNANGGTEIDIACPTGGEGLIHYCKKS
ncbi:predicted protein [Plenodomus lingam JN3]|uniref:Predicted protein n=1 Tax=Leptosphaeria maculans (strain JN3 / isolate v23.1.3 / race Av1-4-5-6-7-8) TaxID=985895 RepID=E5R487_LEPMJ|nr:predicted protein [Plenodomus lingam JN3]CBX91855.1 predicted protein [Plenodomus lingam JN3]